MKASLPNNEGARLETLRRYQILDTPPETAFDDVTLLAAHICGVPIALVSLVDVLQARLKSLAGVLAALAPAKPAKPAKPRRGGSAAGRRGKRRKQ